jgi:hypothetical protein
MLVRPLTTNERAEVGGFTHIGIVTADDLTQTTAAAAQTFNLMPIAKGDVILRAMGIPVVPFQNTSDPAFNSDTVSLGDGGSATRYLAATEANANGAFAPSLGSTAFLYSANDNLVLTVNSMAAKSLVNINRGEYWVLFTFVRSSVITTSLGRQKISKP